MLSWYINRLRSMTLGEVFYRFYQMLIARYERIFEMGKSLKKHKVAFNNTRFINYPISTKIYNDTLNIFGKLINYEKEDIDWHKDIFSGNSFPMTFAKSLNIRNNPNLSAKNVWEMNRLQFLIFIVFNYHNTYSDKYLHQFIKILNSWIDGNPYLIGINWYSNIEVNIRLIVWFFCWQLLDVERLVETNSKFKHFVESKWIPSIYQHCKYSYKNPSRFSSSNNHLISEFAGLYMSSTLWIFKESEKWNRYAQRGLEKEILRQHSTNGINKEEAAEYIQFITDFFFISFIVGEKTSSPFSNNYKEQLRKIFTYIYHLIDKDGNFPKYGDEDDGKCVLFDQVNDFNNFRSLLASGAIIFNDSKFKSKCGGLDTKNMVLFDNDSIGNLGKIPTQQLNEKSKFYRDEGHFIFRKKDENGEIYMHFDAAPLGFLSIAAHGHADALSFVLHIDGHPVFIDPGTYTYHTEPEWRKYFIGTLAHNTIRINKLNQATIAGPTFWLNHYKSEIINVKCNGEIETVKARHNGYYSLGIIHTREINFYLDKMTFIIIDEIKPLNKFPYFIELMFHIHPLMGIYENGDNKILIKNINRKRDSLLELDGELQYKLVRGQTDPYIIGWYSESFMKKEPTTVVLCSIEALGTKKLKTVIKINV